jgi:hypothetical protein
MSLTNHAEVFAMIAEAPPIATLDSTHRLDRI